MVSAAIAGVSASALSRRIFTSSHSVFRDLPLTVLSVGKAGPAMARALMDQGAPVRDGLIIGTHTDGPVPPRFRWLPGTHPVPDVRSVVAANAALALAASSSSVSPLLVLLSGGTSALMALPAPSVTLADKQAVTRQLLAADVPIHALNAVRKHLSSIKGGQLAAAATGPVLTLAISDVVDDDPSVIGSGPTVADTSTFQDALGVIDSAAPRSEFPAAAITRLERGTRGEAPETPKPGDPRLAGSSYAVIASRRDAMAAAAREAAGKGYEPLVLEEPVVGEARKAAAQYAGRILPLIASRPGRVCVISSGETTVRVRGTGRGGRNQEFALALLASWFPASRAVLVASVGTDGVDGPTDAAGATVSKSTLTAAAARGLDPLEYLVRNDAYTFFDSLDGLVKTGPTGTNVGDLQVVLAGPDLRAEE